MNTFGGGAELMGGSLDQVKKQLVCEGAVRWRLSVVPEDTWRIERPGEAAGASGAWRVAVLFLLLQK